jgi:hypothetical protein
MTAERATPAVDNESPLAEPSVADATDGLIAVPLTLPFMGALDPVPTSMIPADVTELLGETISPASGPGGPAAMTGSTTGT